MSRGWSGSDNPMAADELAPQARLLASRSEVGWNNARISRAAPADGIPALKAESGKDLIVFGGARIAHSLIRERLIDETGSPCTRWRSVRGSR